MFSMIYNHNHDHLMGDESVFRNNQNTRLMDTVTYKTSDSSHTLTARASLVAVAELIKRLELPSMKSIDEYSRPNRTIASG